MQPTAPTNESVRIDQLLATRQPLLLFDGVCGLCNFAVDFVMNHDRQKKISFAPLQGDTAQHLLKEFGLPADYLESILFLSEGKLYKSSEAVLQIARRLPFPFPFAYPLIVVPRVLRDAVYRFIAKNRYRWFGKKEACRVPTAEERARFV